MDSLKVAGISAANYFLSLTEISALVQICVGIMTIVYLCMKAYYLKKNNSV